MWISDRINWYQFIHIHFRLRCCPRPILWGWQITQWVIIGSYWGNVIPNIIKIYTKSRPWMKICLKCFSIKKTPSFKSCKILLMWYGCWVSNCWFAWHGFRWLFVMILCQISDIFEYSNYWSYGCKFYRIWWTSDCYNIDIPRVNFHDCAVYIHQGWVLLLRHDAVARILANGSAAFFESCAAIGWKDCNSVRSL